MIKEYFAPSETDFMDDLVYEYETVTGTIDPPQLQWYTNGKRVLFGKNKRQKAQSISEAYLPSVDELCPSYNHNPTATFLPSDPFNIKELQVLPIPEGIGWALYCLNCNAVPYKIRGRMLPEKHHTEAQLLAWAMIDKLATERMS